MSSEFSLILVRVSQVSAFIPVIVGLYFAKRLDPRFKVLLGYVLLSLFTEYFASWYGRVYTKGNMPPLHIYTVIELSCLSYIFCQNLVRQNWKNVYFTVLGISVVLAILNATLLGSIYEMNYISRSYECIVLVIFSLMYFRKSLTILPDAEPIFKQPMFWYSNAALIYFSINLLFFLFFNKLYKQYPGLALSGSILHSLVNIVANLLFAQTFRCFRKAV